MSDDPSQSQSPTTPAAPVAANRFAPGHANLLRATLGAVLGAGVAGGCWLWLAVHNNPDLAWCLAIFLGGFSGLLAAWLGGAHNAKVGTIASFVSAGAIVLSAYFAFSVGLKSESGRNEYRMQFAELVKTDKRTFPATNGFDRAFDVYLTDQIQADDNPKGFIRWMGEKGIEAIVPILMVLCGICFAYLIGGGKGCAGGQCRRE